MKTKFFIMVISALLVGACSSSYHAGSVNDDLYYTPKKISGDNSMAAAPEKNEKAAVPTQKSVTPKSSSQKQPVSDYERYRMAVESGVQDTSLSDSAAQNNIEYYADKSKEAKEWDTPDPQIESEEYYRDGETYVNNYYYDDYWYSPYSYRLMRFHGGYWGYSPFYDPYYYSPGWSFGMSWGYPYYGYGFSFGYNYYGYSDPFYYYPGYNHGYYGGGYYGGGYDNYRPSYSNVKYGRTPNRSGLANSSRRPYSATGIDYNARTRTNSSSIRSARADGYPTSRRNSGTSTERQVYTRRPVESSGTGYNTSQSRRQNSTTSTNQAATNSNNSSRTYTPSYSKPRTYSRPTYNESGSSTRSDGSSSVSTSASRRNSESSSSGSSSGSSRTYTPSSSGRTYSGSNSSSGSSGSSYSGGSSSSSRSSSSGSSGSSGGGSSSSSSSGGGGGGSRRR